MVKPQKKNLHKSHKAKLENMKTTNAKKIYSCRIAWRPCKNKETHGRNQKTDMTYTDTANPCKQWRKFMQNCSQAKSRRSQKLEARRSQKPEAKAGSQKLEARSQKKPKSRSQKPKPAKKRKTNAKVCVYIYILPRKYTSFP